MNTATLYTEIATYKVSCNCAESVLVTLAFVAESGLQGKLKAIGCSGCERCKLSQLLQVPQQAAKPGKSDFV